MRVVAAAAAAAAAVAATATATAESGAVGLTNAAAKEVRGN